jgi:hypothetical protein
MRPWAGIVCVGLAFLPVPRAAAQSCVGTSVPLPSYTYPSSSTYRLYIQAQMAAARRRAELLPPPKFAFGPERLPPPKEVAGPVRIQPPAPRSPPERVPAPVPRP